MVMVEGMMGWGLPPETEHGGGLGDDVGGDDVDRSLDINSVDAVW